MCENGLADGHHKWLMKGKQTMEFSSERLVVDGYQRAWKAIEERVRPQVEDEYADEWNSSGLIRRWFLLGKIEKEIRRRVSLEAPPPDALYLLSETLSGYAIPPPCPAVCGMCENGRPCY